MGSRKGGKGERGEKGLQRGKGPGCGGAVTTMGPSLSGHNLPLPTPLGCCTQISVHHPPAVKLSASNQQKTVVKQSGFISGFKEELSCTTVVKMTCGLGCVMQTGTQYKEHKNYKPYNTTRLVEGRTKCFKTEAFGWKQTTA